LKKCPKFKNKFTKSKKKSEFVFEIENLKFKKIIIFLQKSEIFEIFKLIALLKILLNFGHLFSKNHISVSVLTTPVNF
jgi:hypothetical protein